MSSGFSFFDFARAIGDESRLVANDRHVAIVIAIHANRQATCYPGQERIGRLTGLSQSSVKRSIARLTGPGLRPLTLLERGNGQRSARYQVNMPPWPGFESDLTSSPVPVTPQGGHRDPPGWSQGPRQGGLSDHQRVQKDPGTSGAVAPPAGAAAATPHADADAEEYLARIARTYPGGRHRGDELAYAVGGEVVTVVAMTGRNGLRVTLFFDSEDGSVPNRGRADDLIDAVLRFDSSADVSGLLDPDDLSVVLDPDCASAVVGWAIANLGGVA